MSTAQRLLQIVVDYKNVLYYRTVVQLRNRNVGRSCKEWRCEVSYLLTSFEDEA